MKPDFIIDYLTTTVEDYDQWYIDEAEAIMNMSTLIYTSHHPPLHQVCTWEYLKVNSKQQVRKPHQAVEAFRKHNYKQNNQVSA